MRAMRTLLASSLLALPLTGCAAASHDATPDPASDSADGPGAAAEVDPDSPWGDYGLPGPGAEGTGVAEHIAPVRKVAHLDRLDELTRKQRADVLAVFEELWTRAYWDVAAAPTKGREAKNAYEDLLICSALEYHRKGGKKTFGYVVEPDALDHVYRWRIEDLEVEAVRDYHSTDYPAGSPVSELRASWRESFVYLPGTEGEQQYKKPTRTSVRWVTTGWFVDIDDDGPQPTKLVGWQWRTSDRKSTPVKKRA